MACFHDVISAINLACCNWAECEGEGGRGRERDMVYFTRTLCRYHDKCRSMKLFGKKSMWVYLLVHIASCTSKYAPVFLHFLCFHYGVVFSLLLGRPKTLRVFTFKLRELI